MVVPHQGRERGTQSDLPSVVDDPDRVALVANWPLPRIPAGQRAIKVEGSRRDAAGQPPSVD